MPIDNTLTSLNTLKQEMTSLEFHPAYLEGTDWQWHHQRHELSKKSYATGQQLEQEGYFIEAAQAYWLAFEINPKLAEDRLMLGISSQQVQFNSSCQTLSPKATLDDYFYTGLCYLGGIGCKSNRESAFQAFIHSANQGHCLSQNMLGYMYYKGLGVQQDYQEAVKWFRQAAEQGNASGQSRLGYMYWKGLGVQQDYQEAVKWFRLAAEQGYAHAQSNLGYMNSQGLGVQQDYQEAVKWFRLAAEQGYAPAQYNLGRIFYMQGLGVQQDYQEALKWFRPAAEQNNDSAQNILGFMYSEGLGVQQDYQEALKWHHQAAKKGNTASRENLIWLYRNKANDLPTIPEAAKEYRQDYRNGIKDAAIMLKRCAETNDFHVLYHYALSGCSFFSLFNTEPKTLMAKSPNDFFEAVQADLLLSEAERFKYLKELADKYSAQLSPENASFILFKLADCLFHDPKSDVTTLSQRLMKVCDYILQIPKNTLYYKQGQELLMLVLIILDDLDHNLLLITAKGEAKSKPDEEPKTIVDRWWPDFDQYVKLAMSLQKNIDTISNSNLTNEQIEVLGKLQEECKKIVEQTDNGSWEKTYQHLIEQVQHCKNSESQKKAENNLPQNTALSFITNFFKTEPRNQLIDILNKLLANYPEPELNEIKKCP